MARRDDLRVTRMCRAVLKKHGVALKIVQRRPAYNWDGTDTLRIDCDAEKVSHDTAHYLVATRDERELPEFGLGGSPWARRWTAPTVELSHDDMDDREGAASLLGIMIVALVSRRLAQELWKEHSWDNMLLSSYREAFRSLIDEGHLTWHHGKLVPTEFLAYAN